MRPGSSTRPARFIAVQNKGRDRVLYYIVNTPVIEQDPQYQVSVRCVMLNCRRESKKHYIYLKSAGDAELELIVVSHVPAASSKPFAGRSRGQ
jgi:hypothetical protein